MGRHPSRRHVSPDEAPIGRRIRQRRRELGLTQAHLAGPEYTKSFISQLESGLADPSIDTLRFLSRRLQMALSTLAGDVADQRLAAVEGLLLLGREAMRARNALLVRRALEVAAEVASAAGSDMHRADAQLSLAEFEIEAGDPARAASILDGMSDLAATLGPRGLARRDLAAGQLALRRQDDGAAPASFRSALAHLGRATRHPDLAAGALLGLGIALGRIADTRQARRRLEAAAKLAGRYRLSATHGRALLHLGLLKRQEGAVEDAVRLFQEAGDVLEGTDDHETRIEALIHLGRGLLAAGDAPGALEVARRAMSLAAAVEDAPARARASVVEAEAELSRHQQAHDDRGPA